MADPSQQTQQRLLRLESVQAAVLSISRLAQTTTDDHVFFAQVHREIARLMYAKNFYIALYRPADHSVRYAYNVDEYDPALDPQEYFPLQSPEESPTAWVVLNRQALTMTAAEDLAREQNGLAWGSGARAEHWVGMPLLSHNGAMLGAMVIQSYTQTQLYDTEDIALFELFAQHVANAVEHSLRATLQEQAIFERTAQLQAEVVERRRSEQIQKVLYEISALSSTADSQPEFYKALHQIVAGLIYARNFIILLYDAKAQLISLPYFVDEKDPAPDPELRIPISEGMSSYVLRTRTPQRLDQARFNELVRSGTVRMALGNLDFQSWIGAPLLSDKELFGAIVLQSYDPARLYTDEDLQLLAFVASHVASALARKQTGDQLRAANQVLAEQNLLIGQHNTELSNTLQQLNVANHELAQANKDMEFFAYAMAHDLKAPLRAITGFGALLAESEQTQFADEDRQLLTRIQGSAGQLAERIDAIVALAKLSAVPLQIQPVDLSAQAQAVIEELRVAEPARQIRITIQPAMIAVGDATLLRTVLQNLIENAWKYSGRQALAEIEFSGVEADGETTYCLRDNGAGFDMNNAQNLFRPFARLHSATEFPGSGIGLAHVAKIIHRHHGRIWVESAVEQGTRMFFTLP